MRSRFAAGRSVRLAGAGMEFTGTAAGSVLVGYFLDDYLGTSPWLLMGCFIVGLVGAFYRLIQITRLSDRQRRGGGGSPS